MSQKALSEKYFKDEEFRCKCGKCDLGIAEIKYKALSKLALARDIAGTPFHIINSIRCTNYNKAMGGRLDSPYLDGYAFSIQALDDEKRWRIVRSAIASGFSRIGIYPSYIHLDCDPDKPQDVLWYGKEGL